MVTKKKTKKTAKPEIVKHTVHPEHFGEMLFQLFASVNGLITRLNILEPNLCTLGSNCVAGAEQTGKRLEALNVQLRELQDKITALTTDTCEKGSESCPGSEPTTKLN